MTRPGPILALLLAATAPALAREDAKLGPVASAQSGTPAATSPANPAATQKSSFDSALHARAMETLERGLAYLAARQAELRDGSFPSDEAPYRVPVPVTALAALAFMAGGSQPDRGPYGKAIGSAIDYLCAQTELTAGSPKLGYIASDGDALSRMHGHGFATLALSQAYSMSPKSPRGERTARVLAAAVDRIEQSQGLDGGWFYEPLPVADHENSVTIGLVAALRGAHNVGIKVESKTIARAIDYVRRCQNPDGGFRYGLALKDPSTLALTAASLSTLNAAGQYDTPEVQRGMTNLWQGLEAAETGSERAGNYPYYERMYVAEALWHHRDLRLFERWRDREFQRLISSQAADGSWSDAQFGSCYATASNCLVLALPLGQLPIYQR